jgi:uncharacterized protein (TIGR02118 family)
MVKGIAMLKRKPGLTQEEFIKHYEEVHVPLVLKHLTSIKRYVRNYVISTVVTPPGLEELEFDCITEQWFDDMQGFQAMMDFAASESGRVIRDDERSFLDRKKTTYVLVEETASK